LSQEGTASLEIPKEKAKEDGVIYWSRERYGISGGVGGTALLEG
jgi:hypothetical protein